MGDENKKWGRKEAKSLIITRLNYEEEFTKGRQKKSVLWKKIEQDLGNLYPSSKFSKEDAQRKFINLYTTYRRIKQRNKKSGSEATTWEYFEDFDEVYGTKHSVDVPEENLLSSLTPTLEGPNTTSSDIFDNEVEEMCRPIPKKRCKKTKVETDDVVKLLQEEATKDEQRFHELLDLEKQRLEIEKQRMDDVREMKDILRQFLDISS